MSKSWPLVPMEEVFDIARGGSPRPIEVFLTDDPDGMNWVMISDATESGKYINSTKKRIRAEGVKRSRVVKPGDFLLTNSMSFGRPYVMNTTGCIHDGWLVLSPRHRNVSPDFFYHLLGSNFIYAEFVRRAAGATVKNLNIDLVKSVRVPLPPLAEQRWIAEVLDRAEALRATRRAALAQLDSLTQSLFVDLFGDPFATRETTLQLGEVAEVLMGQSPPGSSYNTNGSGTPLLNGPTEFGDRYPIEKQWTKEPTRLCQTGDILFCVRGATAGRLNRADKTYCLGRGLAAIRPREGMAANVDFLFAVLDRYYDYFQKKGVGSTFININRDELESLPIPKAEQDKADDLARRLKTVEALKTVQHASLVELNALFVSLQHRAFRGEL